MGGVSIIHHLRNDEENEMLIDPVFRNQTKVIIPVFMVDDTTGNGKTGLAHGSMTVYATHGQNTSFTTAVSVVGMSAGTWTSGGWVQADVTNMPGLYFFGIPDALLQVPGFELCLEFRATGAFNRLVRVPIREPGMLGSALMRTTVASVQSTTVYRLTSLPGANDEYIGRSAVFLDASAAHQPSVRRIVDFVDVNNEITVESAPSFTVVASDRVVILSDYIQEAQSASPPGFATSICAKKGVANSVYLFAWDSTTGAAKTGDAGNISTFINGASTTNSVSEISAAGAPGWYKLVLTSAECGAAEAIITGASSTSNIKVGSCHVEFSQDFEPGVDLCDGLTYESVIEAMLAVLAGVTNPVGGVIEFMKRDGTTVKATITMTGDARTLSVI